MPHALVECVLDIELKVISISTGWKSDGEMEQMGLRALMKVSKGVACAAGGLA